MFEQVTMWLGGPLGLLQLAGVLAWIGVIALALAAILGAALAELRPWLPTDVDPEGPETLPGSEWLTPTGWAPTQPMPLYGSQGPVADPEMTQATEMPPRSGPGLTPLRKWRRSVWMDD